MFSLPLHQRQHQKCLEKQPANLPVSKAEGTYLCPCWVDGPESSNITENEERGHAPTVTLQQ